MDRSTVWELPFPAKQDDTITIEQTIYLDDDVGKFVIRFEAKCPNCGGLPSKWYPAAQYVSDLLFGRKSTIRCDLCQFSREIERL